MFNSSMIEQGIESWYRPKMLPDTFEFADTDIQGYTIFQMETNILMLYRTEDQKIDDFQRVYDEVAERHDGQFVFSYGDFESEY